MRAKFLRWTKKNTLDLSSESDLFEIQDSKITIQELPLLKEFLSLNPKITVLNIQHCNLGNQVTEIFDNDSKIKSLIIGGNNLTYAGLKTLAKYQTLAHIDISYSGLTDIQIKEFSRAFSKNKTIKQINLRGNNFGNEGAIALAEMCSCNPSLTEINIMGNWIEEEGARALANVLIDKPKLAITLAPQSGSALPNPIVITDIQWKVLWQKVQDPQKQASRERNFGLHPEIPSLTSISMFAVESIPAIISSEKNEDIENRDFPKSKP